MFSKMFCFLVSIPESRFSEKKNVNPELREDFSFTNTDHFNTGPVTVVTHLTCLLAGFVFTALSSRLF